MSLIQGLDCVSVHVHDIAKARDFYTRILGLEEEAFDEAGRQLRVRLPDGARLTFHVQMPGEAGREAGTITGILLRVADARRAMGDIERRGGRAYDLWEAPWGATYATVADPDGNELLLVERRAAPTH